MAVWITDVGHLPPVSGTEVPEPAQRRAAFTVAVTEAATYRATNSAWRSAAPCIGRFGRKRCRAYVAVSYSSERTVAWTCARCGDSGEITGVAGTPHDLSAFAPSGQTVAWGIDARERDVLLSATEFIPTARAVVARASPHAEVPGLLLIRATAGELDEIYTLVEELAEVTTSARRVELLDDLRASLCNSMDRF